MNRLFALLAVSTLGTGCVVSDTCEHTVSLGWPSFELANGSITTSCATAGAATVDVYMGTSFVGNVDCAAGGVNVVGVRAGGHVFTAEALDSGGNIILRDSVSAGTDLCDVLVEADTEPAEGTFELAYSFSPVNTCTVGGSYIWFTLHDDTAGQDTVVVEDDTYACGDLIRFALPKGPHTLVRTEEVTFSGGAYHAAARNCSAAPFDVFAGTESVVGAVMADSASFCP